jgi:hypothetical protein
MKKLISTLMLSLALVSVAAPALANDGKDHKGLNLKTQIGGMFRSWKGAEKFGLVGTVTAISGSNLTINVETRAHLKDFTGTTAVIVTNASTKFATANKNTTVTFADIKVGDRIVAAGKLDGTTLTAVKVWEMGVPAKKSYGKVTAVTDTAITIQNNTTGTTQTFTVDGDTKVAINGETKTISDVQVGDVGVVKSQSKGNVSLWAKFLNLFR